MADIPLRGPATATIGHAQAWARQRNGARLPEVDAYLSEIWRISARIGYDAAVVAAQSSLETDGWATPNWRQRLNPARLTDPHIEIESGFSDGVEAARAHLVRLSAHIKGYEQRLQPFIHLDHGWQRVFERGQAGRARSIDDLGGAWGHDLHYGRRVEQHLDGIRAAFQRPDVPPDIVVPQTEVQVLATGNWSERTFGQDPLAIVFHTTGDTDLQRTIAWFQNPISRASTHALIDRDGRIFQFVDARRAAWSANDFKNPRRDIPWLNSAIAGNLANGGATSLDDFILSIDVMGEATRPPTEAQYRSLIALSAAWSTHFGFIPNRGRMLRHSDLNSVDRANCPGRAFDLTRIIEALGGAPDDFRT